MSAIISIAKVPAPYCYTSHEVSLWMKQVFREESTFRKFEYLLRESHIKSKYSVLPDFSLNEKQPMLFLPRNCCYKDPGTRERMKIFNREAIKLATEAAQNCILNSPFQKEEITHIITVTCTGLSAPGLEIQISKTLDLPKETHLMTVNFMGCYAAFHALKLADIICKAVPSSKVLIICVELCTIHFKSTSNNDNLLSTLLFSDGAAAVMVTNENVDGVSLQLSGFSSLLIPEGEKEMGWEPGDNGFEMRLTAKVPAYIQQNMQQAFHSLLQKVKVKPEQIGYYAIHPGGKAILKAFSKALELREEQLDSSFGVLSQFGNMSSPTVLFVLEDIWQKFSNSTRTEASVYAAAFGPGLTIESGLWNIKK
ncbi:MAG: type III polyketide synthase [Anditalea sp.]